MASPKLSRLLLIIGDALLAGALIVPWISLVTMPADTPIMQYVSPALVLWDTMWPTPGTVGGGALAAGSLIYLGAMTEVIGLSIPLVRRKPPGNRSENLKLAVLPGAFICFFMPLLAGPVLFYGLTLGGQYTDATLGVGLLLAAIGAVLALLGATRISME